MQNIVKGKEEFVSLNLNELSLQSLIWILKSIKLDLMTPCEKLVISRIKQCFALKITTKNWEKILNCIKKNKY